MAAGRLVLPQWMPAVDSDGIPLPNAEAFFYQNKTTTLATIYADEDLTTPLPNPVAANSSGRFPAIWADDGALYSATVTADYIPQGTPFTFDDLMPSQAADAVIAAQAEAAAAQAAIDAAAAAAALAEIEDIAANAPDAPSVVNKANRDGDNIVSADFRIALDTAQIPTLETYGSQQAAADVAYAGELPFFGSVNSVIALTCADGRLDTLCRKIGGWPIGDQGRVNVTVPAGKYIFTAGQRVSFPFGQRVQIAGATPTTLAFSSVVSVVSNATRDHDVTIEVADGSSLAVGDVVVMRGVTGTGSCGLFGGCFVVTAKPTANRFTYKHKARGTSFGAYTVSAMTVKKINTVLEFQGSSGLTIHGRMGDGSSGAQTGGFRDIAIIGDASGSFNGMVLDVGAEVVVQGELGVSNFGGDNIYGIYNSILYAVFLCSSNSGGNGLYWLSGGVAQGVSGCFTGNNTFGAYGAYGCALSFSNASCSGNLNGYGVLSASAAGNNMQLHDNTSGGVFATNGFMDVQGSSVISTGTYGLRATKGARINAATVTSSGHTNDLYADGGSVIENSGATATTLSPAQNTYGNGGSIIINSATATTVGAFSSVRVTDADPILYLTDGSNTASRVSGDVGNMRVISQSVNRDVYLSYDSAGTPVDVWHFDMSASAVLTGGVQILSTRKTGWAAPTGTATRTTFATGSVTLPQLAERVKGLIDDLTSHGLIGA